MKFKVEYREIDKDDEVVNYFANISIECGILYGNLFEDKGCKMPSKEITMIHPSVSIRDDDMLICGLVRIERTMNYKTVSLVLKKWA